MHPGDYPAPMPQLEHTTDWYNRPTCIFLAAKTTNNPLSIDLLTPRFKGLKASDVLDTEFLLAQSLSFEFWVRGAEKALRGWALELQVGHLQINHPSAPLFSTQTPIS
jgi:hypothetical protein